MRSFYFQLEDGGGTDDRVGSELPSEAAARARAIRLARQIAARSSRVRSRSWAVVVTDAAGIELMSVHIPQPLRRRAA